MSVFMRIPYYINCVTKYFGNFTSWLNRRYIYLNLFKYPFNILNFCFWLPHVSRFCYTVSVFNKTRKSFINMI